MPSQIRADDLSIYVVAGRAPDPRVALRVAAAAEAAGFGGVYGSCSAPSAREALRLPGGRSMASSFEREGVVVRARAVSYLQGLGLGDLLVTANGWDPAVLTRIGNHPTLAGRGIADTALTRDRLIRHPRRTAPGDSRLSQFLVENGERLDQRATRL